ncbi:MAG: hypothetical protein IT285_03420 [Bdellovibrionales bacterium]|nr:hypothetical protein [Bdellovibrionales bacterium]
MARLARWGSALPLFWFLGIITLYLRARAHLGHWPHPSIDDPKLLPFEVHHFVLAFAFYPLIATLVALPMLWFFQKRYLRMPIRKNVAGYLTGWALIAATFLIPGVRLVEWFLD